ncbi:MAG: family 20 glycosylhydrolase [Oscillospiraceae bacterium]|nr:family 20 glycosylhydrolase [Oscillospiraceae bacterium]
MYIGYLQDPVCRYTRIGSDIPYAPTQEADGISTWSWETLLNTGMDVRIDLAGTCFVGSVTLPLAEGSLIRGFEVLAEDTVVGRYTAETGKLAGGMLTASVGTYASALTVRIYADLYDISFTAPQVAICRADAVPFLWPTVKNAVVSEGSVRIGAIMPYSRSEDESAVAGFLREGLAEKFGGATVTDGVTVTVRLASQGYENERYTVEVTKEGIALTAGCRLTLMYAACKLLQLGKGGEFPVIKIDDQPTKSLRGFHMYLPAVEDIEFAKRLFRYVLLPLGYNTLFVEFAGGMRFDRHPEISQQWVEANARAKAGLQPPFPHGAVAGGGVLEKQQVIDLLDNAREYGFEIIPEAQSLGHVQYITNAHPEIAEREEQDKDVKDTRTEDERPANFYAHCYCPSNEKSYEIIFDIIDEIIEVAKPPRYVHIGHDEVYHLGLCPKCKDTPHDVLYARHVNRLYNYLKAKGLGTVIWSDMIQPVTRYQTHNAINLIPKDVLCLDFIWYFHLDKDIETNLLEAGFTVGAGNLYSSHYPRYKKRMLQKGMIGGEVSLWCSTNEYYMGKKGKFYDLSYTAQMLWNTEVYDEALREVYAHLIAQHIQPAQRDGIRERSPLHSYMQTDIPLPAGDQTLPQCILAYRPAAIVADSCRVDVNGRFERLLIEHTTLQCASRIPWQALYVAGTYTVSYEDGEQVTIPAEYLGNVQHYCRKYADPLSGKYYRHMGYVGTWFSEPTLEEKYNGEDVLLTSVVWENPHPEKKISSLSYRSAEGDFTTVVLTRVTGLADSSV